MVKLTTNQERSLLFVEVSDTGIGIEDDKKQHLFSVFRSIVNRIDEKRSTSGVGIGLTNAKILCEGLNGNIEVISKVNKGTSVTFSIEMNNSEVISTYLQA